MSPGLKVVVLELVSSMRTSLTVSAKHLFGTRSPLGLVGCGPGQGITWALNSSAGKPQG